MSTPALRRDMICIAACVFLFAGENATAQIGFRQVTSTHPVAVQRGATAEVKLNSNFTLDETYAVFFNKRGLKMTFLEEKPIKAPRRGRGSVGTPFRFRVEAPEDQPPGVYEYRVATKQAVSSVAQLLITPYPVVIEEKKQNGSPETAQEVAFPVAVCGVCEAFEDVDCYRFTAKAGQELTFEIYAQRVTDKIHSMVVKGPRIYLMDPILTLIGPNGQVVAQNDNFHGGDSFIAQKLTMDGQYTLEVRDARYAGNGRYSYCVEIADAPYAHALFPMAVQHDSAAQVEVIGHMLGDMPPAKISADASKDLGWTHVQIETPRGRTNPVSLLISPHPQQVEVEGNNSIAEANEITFPIGVNGRLNEADDIDYYSFDAKKGQRLVFEIEANRHGSPLDSVLELYDSEGKLLTEADDLSTLKTKDSRLFWTPPADGKYAVAVRDLESRGGPRFVYHLRAEVAEPNFEMFGEYYYAFLAPGSRMIWFARVERQNGFDGPVAVEVENLPPGVTATTVTIPHGMSHCGVILSAAKDAKIDASLVRIRGRAKIQGENGQEREIVRYGRVTCEQQSSGGGQARWLIDTQIVGVTGPLDLTRVTAQPQEITLKPGQSAEIDVKIERAEGFTAPVTLAMSFDYFKNKFGEQLPPGVAMSSGSKARLTGKVLEGKIVLEASDKALPVQRLPIAVLARVSVTFSITTNYASNPVYLTVEAADKTATAKK